MCHLQKSCVCVIQGLSYSNILLNSLSSTIFRSKISLFLYLSKTKDQRPSRTSYPVNVPKWWEKCQENIHDKPEGLRPIHLVPSSESFSTFYVLEDHLYEAILAYIYIIKFFFLKLSIDIYWCIRGARYQ